MCLASSCSDKMKDGTETNVDCGGGKCAPCLDGKGCTTGSDCADQVCSGGTCLPPACTDKVKNGTETDVDCGGSCPPCAAGKNCGQAAANCESMVCTGGTCQATCTDGVKDGAETDLDCGGPTCMPCADTKGLRRHGWRLQERHLPERDMRHHRRVEQELPRLSAATNSVTYSGLAVDAANNVLLTGAFAGTINFGDGPLSSSGISASATSGLVAKYDGSGNPVWSDVVASSDGSAQLIAVTS